MANDPIIRSIKDSISLKERLLNNEGVKATVRKLCDLIVQSLEEGGKVLFCGNGGSAADAQHLAAELSGRYYLDRRPLFAVALHENPAYLTAVSNDYSYASSLKRLTDAMGNRGDVIIGLSTSGNSENVIHAMEMAKSKGMITVGFTGGGGGKLKSHCDHIIDIPSKDTPRIQECHMLIGHILCEMVEAKLFA